MVICDAVGADALAGHFAASVLPTWLGRGNARQIRSTSVLPSTAVAGLLRHRYPHIPHPVEPGPIPCSTRGKAPAALTRLPPHPRSRRTARTPDSYPSTGRPLPSGESSGKPAGEVVAHGQPGGCRPLRRPALRRAVRMPGEPWRGHVVGRVRLRPGRTGCRRPLQPYGDDDFAKSRHMGACGDHFTIYERVRGVPTDDLDVAGMRAMLPSAPDALAEIDVSVRRGTGSWGPDGDAHVPDWPTGFAEDRLHGPGRSLGGLGHRGFQLLTRGTSTCIAACDILQA